MSAAVSVIRVPVTFSRCYPPPMPRRHEPDAPIRGAVLLGQILAVLPTLVVECNRCDRRDRLSTARLLAQYRPEMPVPDCCV